MELLVREDLTMSSAPHAVETLESLGIPARTEFARATLEGSANSFGGHVGIYGKPNEKWTFGLRFLTPLEFEYDGAEATFVQVQTDIVLTPGNAVGALAISRIDSGGVRSSGVANPTLSAPATAT